MPKLEFSYSTWIVDQEGEERLDGGLISFNVDFDKPPEGDDFLRTCYSIATDEVIAVLTEKYGDLLFRTLPDLTVRISGLSIT